MPLGYLCLNLIHSNHFCQKHFYEFHHMFCQILIFHSSHCLLFLRGMQHQNFACYWYFWKSKNKSNLQLVYHINSLFNLNYDLIIPFFLPWQLWSWSGSWRYFKVYRIKNFRWWFRFIGIVNFTINFFIHVGNMLNCTKEVINSSVIKCLYFHEYTHIL